MAEFRLPENSRVQPGQEHKAPAGATRVRRFHVYRYDPASGYRSMSRTTAFPATIVARRALEGRITTPGVLPPEKLAAIPGLVDEVMAELGERGVRYHASTRVLPGSPGARA